MLKKGTLVLVMVLCIFQLVFLTPNTLASLVDLQDFTQTGQGQFVVTENTASITSSGNKAWSGPSLTKILETKYTDFTISLSITMDAEDAGGETGKNKRGGITVYDTQSNAISIGIGEDGSNRWKNQVCYSGGCTGNVGSREDGETIHFTINKIGNRLRVLVDENTYWDRASPLTDLNKVVLKQAGDDEPPEFTVTFEDLIIAEDCIDKDGDGFCGTSNGIIVDCEDNLENNYCQERVCCQHTQNDDEFMWGIKTKIWGIMQTKYTCNRDPNWKPADKIDKCQNRARQTDMKDSLEEICSNELFKGCSYCINPGISEDGCGVDRNCDGTISTNTDEKNCVIYGTGTGKGHGYTSGDWECTFKPAREEEHADCSAYQDATLTSLNPKLFTCFPESEQIVLDENQQSRFAGLDIEKFSNPQIGALKNPCSDLALLDHQKPPNNKFWKTTLVEPDLCLNGLDDDGKENLFNILEKWGIENKKIVLKESGTELGGNEVLVHLSDVDDPDCYDAVNLKKKDAEGNPMPYCLDLDEDLFCDTEEDYVKAAKTFQPNIDEQEVKRTFKETFAASKAFPDCDGYLGDDNHEDSPYWWTYTPTRFYKRPCNEFPDDRYRTNGTPTLDELQTKRLPGVPEEYCKITGEKKFLVVGEGKRIYLDAAKRHPFANMNPANDGTRPLIDIAAACSLDIDLNCNKNLYEGYDVSLFLEGDTPFDNDENTGIERVSCGTNSNVDFLCYQGATATEKVINEMRSKAKVYGVSIVLMAPFVSIAPIPMLILGVGLSGLGVGYESYKTVEAFIDGEPYTVVLDHLGGTLENFGNMIFIFTASYKLNKNIIELGTVSSPRGPTISDAINFCQQSCKVPTHPEYEFSGDQITPKKLKGFDKIFREKIVGDPDKKTTTMIREAYSRTLGKVTKKGDQNEIRKAAEQFALEMNDKLPFLKQKNMGAWDALPDTSKRTIGQNLKDVKFGAPGGKNGKTDTSLKARTSSGDMLCYDQALAIQRALPDEGFQPVMLALSEVSPAFKHVVVAKPIMTTQGERVIFIDPGNPKRPNTFGNLIETPDRALKDYLYAGPGSCLPYVPACNPKITPRVILIDPTPGE